ncbi:MAG: 2,3,4,5-tetrahydropyridine-2,6-dicarboxylate N-succinyltransferase, partial [Acidimicrobiia bacterium]
METLAEDIAALWGSRAELGPEDDKARSLVRQAIGMLDRGEARVAEVRDGQVVVHEWLKQAILLCFRLEGLAPAEVGPFEYHDRL